MTSRLLLLMMLAAATCASADGPAQRLCEIARSDDFKGAGLAGLETYVEDLAVSRGPLVALAPRDVTLEMAAGEPKPAPGGITAGEIGCSADGGPPYRIALYPGVLEGRPLAVAY